MQNIWTLPSCGEGATRALADTGFPKGVSIKHLGVCVPDLKCMNAPSPYYYVDVKAKLRWKEEEKQAKAVKKPANEPFTCSQRVSV